MRNPLFAPTLSRVIVHPDDPEAMTAPRPRGSRRPHSDARVEAVRRLVEDSTMTYAEIAARTGVAPASICRWTQNQNWKRPPFAPRATDTVPRARASAKLRRRTLAARLDALAERHIRELEAAPAVDPKQLAEALELVKMAKLATKPRERWLAHPHWPRPKPRRGEAPARTLARLAAYGVDLDRVPLPALADFVKSHGPPEQDHPALRARERRRRAG